jgi:hypothetical protein
VTRQVIRNNTSVKRATAALVLLWLALCATPLFSQNVVSGDIAGTVTDTTGAVVSGANVELKNPDTGFDKKLTTGATGTFRFPLLRPGEYVLSVSSPQFAVSTKSVTVQLGQVTDASIALGVASKSESVEVSAEAPLIETENGNNTTTISQKAIDQIPNPGGDITYYAQLTPGIAMNTSGSGYGNFSAFGLPSTSNLFTENGNDENDPFLNLNNSGSSNLLLGKNEVQEAAVVTNGYTGQYGRMAGAAVNYTTKYGTNGFHGDASYDWNGRAMNANDYFNNRAGTPRPFANNNQWAADFGGPIVKNKTYFYVDTEGLRYILPSGADVYYPTATFANSVLANIAATQPGQLGFYQQMIKLYTSAPAYNLAVPYNQSPAFTQGGDSTGGCADFAGSAGFGGANPCLKYYHATGNNLNKEWLLTGRIDQNLGSKDTLFGRFKMDRGEQPTSTDLINNSLFGTSSSQPTYEGQLNETHTFNGRMVNTFIASGSWYSAIFERNSGEATALAALPYSTVSFIGTNLATLGGTTPSAPDFAFPQGRNVTQYQIIDDLSISKGHHELKMGANFRRNDITDYDPQILNSGFLNFSSITDFYNGLVNGIGPSSGDFYQQSFPSHPTVPLAIYSLGLYLQDTWKVKPNLTLTLALRADRNSNAVCQTDCFSRLTSQFSNISHDVSIPYNQVITPDQHAAFGGLEAVAWQPRFGFAWSPGGSGNNVFRGGVGIFSDLYAGVLLDNLVTNSPGVNIFQILGSNLAPSPAAPGVPGSVSQIASNSNSSFLSGFGNGATLAQIQASNPFFAPPNFYSVGHITNPKYVEWNFEYQHQITANDLFSMNYVGNHGYDLLIQNPGLNAFGPVAGAPTSPLDPRFGSIFQLSNSAISNYNGLVTSFTHRFSHTFQVMLSYTWSHALDETSSVPNTPFSSAQTIPNQINPYNLRSLNYSSGDGDVRNNFVASYVWDVPGKFGNSFANAALGGWQFGGTVFVRSGLPYSVIDTAAINSLSNFGAGVANGGFVLPTFTGGNIPSCSSPNQACVTSAMFNNGLGAGTETSFGNLPRNSFRGPGYFDSDLSANKNFKLTERVNLRIGANFYNIFNHANFQAPSSNLANSATFGQILATAPAPTNPYGAFQQAGVSGRLVQFEGKVTF